LRARLHDDLASCQPPAGPTSGTRCGPRPWPWGRFCSEALEIAKEVGFSVFFTTKPGPICPGGSADAVCRFKARNRGARWLLSRVGVYSRPLLARAYGAIRS
jgi:peptidoglycan/xylan/chitin deacetylase (PgdA/CDA1 family)